MGPLGRRFSPMRARSEHLNLFLRCHLFFSPQGTNVKEGKRIIKESGINVLAADDLDDAAQKAVHSIA